MTRASAPLTVTGHSGPPWIYHFRNQLRRTTYLSRFRGPKAGVTFSLTMSLKGLSCASWKNSYNRYHVHADVLEIQPYIQRLLVARLAQRGGLRAHRASFLHATGDALGLGPCRVTASSQLSVAVRQQVSHPFQQSAQRYVPTLRPNTEPRCKHVDAHVLSTCLHRRELQAASLSGRGRRYPNRLSRSFRFCCAYCIREGK